MNSFTDQAQGLDDNEFSMPKTTPMPEGNEPLVEEALEAVPELTEEERLRGELSEVKEHLLRLAADFENYKKTAQREKANSVKFANDGLVSSLLPIVDGLMQALEMDKSENKSDVIVGIDMVIKQLIELLKKFGVEVFSAIGKNFDPALHEAMGEQVDDSVEAGQVIIEYQKGYLLHGRLLRPARVIIAKKSTVS